MDANAPENEEELIRSCMRQGRRLLRGRGVPRDYERALECFDRAARAGDTDALYMLGKCYLKGVGCRKDPNGGVDCLERAAERGHGAAALRLGKRHTGTVALLSPGKVKLLIACSDSTHARIPRIHPDRKTKRGTQGNAFVLKSDRACVWPRLFALKTCFGPQFYV